MRYRAEVDGLRAIAVLPVILFHTGLRPFQGGFVGVDVFFVISGYLITAIIRQDVEAGQFSFARFYERRARRILPALAVVILASLPFAWFWLSPFHLRQFARSVGAVTLFGSNVLFWGESGYFATAGELKPLLHTWSLAVEEQFYLLYPLFLVWLLGRGRRPTMIAVLLVATTSLALAELGALVDRDATFYLLPARAWELLLGAGAALLQEEGRRVHWAPRHLAAAREGGSALGLALILGAIVAFDPRTPVPGVHALLPTLGATLVLLCAGPDTLAGRLLHWRPLVAIGLVSYSAYLWHQPLFAFARHRSLTEPGAPTMLALSAVALLLAAGTWRWIEMPARHGAWLTTRALTRAGVAVGAGFLLLAVVGDRALGFPERRPASYRALLTTRDRHMPLAGDGRCMMTRHDAALGDCVRGDARGARRLFLVGDSHAAALAPALARHATQRRLAVVQHTKSSCPLALNVVSVTSPSCAAYVEALLGRLTRDAPDAIVIASRWSYYLSDDDYVNGRGGREVRPRENHFSVLGVSGSAPLPTRRALIMRAFEEGVSRVLALGMPVVLVYPVPEHGWDVPERMAKIAMWSDFDAGALAVPNATVARRHAEVEALFDALGERPNLIRLRPTQILCGNIARGGCAGQVDGVPLYFDDNHLSDTGADLIVRPMLDSLDRIMSS
jgi:peptidoglycan/LPS O-acetylase OafA/YrhL